MSVNDLVACACGCGELFPHLDSLNRPRRFKHGHNSRFREKGTYYSTRGGRRLHAIRAETALGHPLPPHAEVHHVGGSKSDTAPLVICENRAYHLLLHVREKTLRAGGNPNTEKVCGDCLIAKPFDLFHLMRSNKSNGRHTLCKDCIRIRGSKRPPRPSRLRRRKSRNR